MNLGCPDPWSENKVVDVINYIGTDDVNTKRFEAGRAEEALSGLARGFFYAGSRSMLVTHWSVESESAMLLTTQTFAAYKKDPELRRSEALRQAMLETMRLQRFAHPTYWAPYALVGEGGR